MRSNASAIWLAAFLSLTPALGLAQAPAPDTGTADPAPAATLPAGATVVHVPPGQAPGGHALRIAAVVDAAWTEAALFLRYRPAGTSAPYDEHVFERSSAGGYHATIPAAAMRAPGVEYYIAGTQLDGNEREHFASRHAPHRIVVAPSPAELWAQAERRRLGGYLSSMSMDVRGHDFGNRYLNDDRFVRGELDWTHRLLGRLYAISIGYGMIEGRTPSNATPMAVAERQGARYGYGGVQLRLHPSVWLEGRATLGVSRSQLIVGGAATLTLGKPWRANLSVGGELLEELGPSAWVRLQWDTVPPLLMGATIMMTDLPAATLENGSYIIYDIFYPVAGRLGLRGSLSFGSRDGPGHFGGGLGATVAF